MFRDQYDNFLEERNRWNWYERRGEESVLVIPDLDYPVTSPCHDSSHPSSCSLAFYPRLTRYQTSRLRGWRPRDGVDPLTVRGEDLVCPIPLLEFQNGYLAVGRGAGE